MKYMHIHVSTFIYIMILLCMAPHNCFSAIDQQAVTAKESADKALAEATTAELSKSSHFASENEKFRSILDKSMSALNAAQSAINSSEFITGDKNQSAESKKLAEDAKRIAKQAIKKVGSTLNSL